MKYHYIDISGLRPDHILTKAIIEAEKRGWRLITTYTDIFEFWKKHVCMQREFTYPCAYVESVCTKNNINIEVNNTKNNFNMEQTIKINLNGKIYNVDFERAKELGVVKEEVMRPRTWEEYVNKLEKEPRVQYVASGWSQGVDRVGKLNCCGKFNRFNHEEDANAFIALGRLIQLRDAWWNGWLPCCGQRTYGISKYDTGFELVTYKCDCSGLNRALVFPTEEMRDEFLKCFKDLIEEALILI